MVIWLTGLSSSGKTTLGRLIFDLWKPDAPDRSDLGPLAVQILGAALNH